MGHPGRSGGFLARVCACFGSYDELNESDIPSQVSGWVECIESEDGAFDGDRRTWFAELAADELVFYAHEGDPSSEMLRVPLTGTVVERVTKPLRSLRLTYLKDGNPEMIYVTVEDFQERRVWTAALERATNPLRATAGSTAVEMQERRPAPADDSPEIVPQITEKHASNAREKRSESRDQTGTEAEEQGSHGVETASSASPVQDPEPEAPAVSLQSLNARWNALDDIPAPTETHLIDDADIIDVDNAVKIETECRMMMEDFAAPVCVVVVRPLLLGDGTPLELAHDAFARWKIGAADWNAGMLLLCVEPDEAAAGRRRFAIALGGFWSEVDGSTDRIRRVTDRIVAQHCVGDSVGSSVLSGLRAIRDMYQYLESGKFANIISKPPPPSDSRPRVLMGTGFPASYPSSLVRSRRFQARQRQRQMSAILGSPVEIPDKAEEEKKKKESEKKKPKKSEVSQFLRDKNLGHLVVSLEAAEIYDLFDLRDRVISKQLADIVVGESDRKALEDALFERRRSSAAMVCPPGIPPAPVTPDQLVIDTSGELEEASVDLLSQLLYENLQEHSVPIFVVVVNDTGEYGDQAARFGADLYDNWGIGSRYWSTGILLCCVRRAPRWMFVIRFGRHWADEAGRAYRVLQIVSAIDQHIARVYTTLSSNNISKALIEGARRLCDMSRALTRELRVAVSPPPKGWKLTAPRSDGRCYREEKHAPKNKGVSAFGPVPRQGSWFELVSDTGRFLESSASRRIRGIVSATWEQHRVPLCIVTLPQALTINKFPNPDEAARTAAAAWFSHCKPGFSQYNYAVVLLVARGWHPAVALGASWSDTAAATFSEIAGQSIAEARRTQSISAAVLFFVEQATTYIDRNGPGGKGAPKSTRKDILLPFQSGSTRDPVALVPAKKGTWDRISLETSA